jgi:hypothetical protein
MVGGSDVDVVAVSIVSGTRGHRGVYVVIVAAMREYRHGVET